MRKTLILQTITLVLVLAIIATFPIFLSGCSYMSENVEENTSKNPAENIIFELEEVWSGQTGNLDVSHYRDTTTNIMYLYDAGIRRGGYTVMPDPETGLPLTYERYLEIYTAKEN